FMIPPRLVPLYSSKTSGSCAKNWLRSCPASSNIGTSPRTPARQPQNKRLMAEMPHAGEDHGEIMLVRRGDDFGVAHRAAGLDQGRDAQGRGRVDAIAERKECVRSQDDR